MSSFLTRLIPSWVNNPSSSQNEERAESDIVLSLSQLIDNKYLLSIIGGYSNVKPKKRLFLLIDVSVSMGGERLNLVKHAIKTIISSSDENIEICIMTFSSVFKIKSELKPMTTDNKNEFMSIISSLDTENSTDLLDGLSGSMKHVKSILNLDSIDTHLLLFTDGEPNDGVITNYDLLLKQYLSDPTFKCIIDVFGFGNQLNLDVLQRICQIGKGIWGYISDRNMLATIFNNYLANLITTTYYDIVFNYEVGFEFKSLSIGNLIALQERNFIIEVPTGASIGAACLIHSNGMIEYESLTIEAIPESKMYYHLLRTELCDLKDVHGLRILCNRYSSLDTDDVFRRMIEILFNDITSVDPTKGQINLAFKTPSWGKYYLPSILDAHKTQTCINFKDESIQGYSGPIAKLLLGKLDNNFNSIPFVSSYSRSYSGGSSSQSSPASISATSYNNRNAGCFDANCRLKDGRTLGDLKPDDMIGNIKITHILKTKCEETHSIFKLNELIGTGNHPIMNNNCEIMTLKEHPDAVILTDHSTEWLISFAAIDENGKPVSFIEIEGVQCATFGHGHLDCKEGYEGYSILSSTFWGKMILEIIKNNSTNNVLTLDGNYSFIRDLKTGWIVDIEIKKN